MKIKIFTLLILVGLLFLSIVFLTANAQNAAPDMIPVNQPYNQAQPDNIMPPANFAQQPYSYASHTLTLPRSLAENSPYGASMMAGPQGVAPYGAPCASGVPCASGFRGGRPVRCGSSLCRRSACRAGSARSGGACSRPVHQRLYLLQPAVFGIRPVHASGHPGVRAILPVPGPHAIRRISGRRLCGHWRSRLRPGERLLRAIRRIHASIGIPGKPVSCKRPNKHYRLFLYL